MSRDSNFVKSILVKGVIFVNPKIIVFLRLCFRGMGSQAELYIYCAALFPLQNDKKMFEKKIMYHVERGLTSALFS